MIEIQELTQSFGAFRAVDGISLSVRPGEVLGFLGPNGAGKSTTMKMVTGFLRPTSGRVTVCGHDVQRETLAAQRRIGYLPEGAPLYPDMTPRRLLRFCGEARGLRGATLRGAVDAAVARLELEEVLDKRIEQLSKGFKRRVGLAQAILHDPDVLILDEPTDGLDPNQKRGVRRLIREMARDKAIVLSTHILEEVEAVCTRAVLIAEGRLRFDGTPAELRARSRFHRTVVLGVRGTESATLRAAFDRHPQVASCTVELERDGVVHLRLFPATEDPCLPPALAVARERGWELVQVESDPGRLEDVFRLLTRSGTEEREPEAPARAAAGADAGVAGGPGDRDPGDRDPGRTDPADETVTPTGEEA